LLSILRTIINGAKENNAHIVIGDLKGVRKSVKDRRMNRIVSNMSYYRLTQMIQVVKVNERYTSKMCHGCGKRGKRISQGFFMCPHCEIEYNADLNGAINIAKRSLDDMSSDGAVLDTTHNSGEMKLC